MQIYSGTTTKLYIVAVDGTDFTTRQTGLAIFGWTVYNSHNGGSASSQSVSVTEVDGTNMPGVYHISWTAPTITAGADFEEGTLHITHSSGIAPITRAYTLSRPKITAGDTLSSTAPPTAAAIADAVWTEPIADHSGTAGSTAEALDGISNGNALTVQGIVDGVWDEPAINHVLSGTFGERLESRPTAAGIADAVWDEILTTGHSITNSASEILQNTSSGGGASAADIADAVWNELQADHVAAGSFGEIATEIASILTDTNELQSNQGDWATATGFNTVAPDNASIAAILADTNELQQNQGNWLTATGFNTVAPDNASIAAILADTNELQLNQNNWLTATGFSTHSAGDVWDQAHASHVTDGTFGAHLLISTNQNHEVQVTGSNHIAADIHEFQANVLTADATDATFVAEISSGGGGASASDIYDYFVDGTREDAFKADLTGIATSADVAALSSGGTGLNQITVRVQDTNSNALQGAVVNIDDTVLSLVTSPTGEVVFNLDASSYTFDISPPAGYSTPASQTLSVTGDATLVFTLTGGTTGGSVNWVG